MAVSTDIEVMFVGGNTGKATLLDLAGNIVSCYLCGFSSANICYKIESLIEVGTGPANYQLLYLNLAVG